MEIQYRRLDEITPYDKNAKTHDQTQINNVAESIRQYGFVQPIVIDRDGIIVIGHCRTLEKRPPDEPGSKKMIMQLFLIISCIKIIKGAA